MLEFIFSILAMAITGWITYQVAMAKMREQLQKTVEEELARRAVPNLDEIRALTEQVRQLTVQLDALRRS